MPYDIHYPNGEPDEKRW